MKCIILFGAGKSATALIEYLKQLATDNVWQVIVADSDIKMARQKTGNHPLVKAVKTDINNDKARKALVQQGDIVISLLPPALHYLVALDCILFHKHLLTASYIDDKLRELEKDIQHRNLLFLCEMGLDPGIDHMSAMQLIHRIKNKGGIITSFQSHCGGLVSPECDDNPWHYKISWNPRNIVLAGKAGAAYKEDGKEINVDYADLFNNNKTIEIPNLGLFAYYPNRDSLNYSSLYNLSEANTFIRTTLRHPEFCFGWKNIIDLKLTDEEKKYDTNGLSISAFFNEHLSKNGFGNWLNEMLLSRLASVKDMMEKLTKLIDAEEDAGNEKGEVKADFMVVDEKGQLTTHDINDIKDQASESVASQMQEANLSIKQLLYLGLEDETPINKGLCSAADVLQFILEKKLSLNKGDKDMVVMMHDIEYTINEKNHKVQSLLIAKGEDNVHTAMAKTVGLPLGIAAKLILEGKINETGLHIPVIPSIYNPVLKELEANNVRFEEKTLY